MILKWNKIPLIKADDFYKDLANYIEKWFDTSNCDEGRTKKQFVKKLKKQMTIIIIIIIIIIGLVKDEKRSKVIRNFTTSAPKIYVSIVQKNDHEIAESEFKKAKE